MTLHALCARVMRGAACSPRKRSARRAARDASSRLVLPFVLLQMVATLLFPSGAFALSPNDQGVLWGPTSLGGGNSGIVVSATNNFDAALWAIGRWNTKIQLDHPKFVMLSNADTGGHFYELASYFHSYAEVGSPGWPNAAAVEGYAISLGPENVWLASVPSSLISDARRDYNTVLNGGSLGGGGGSGGEVVGDVVYLTFTGTHRFVKNTATNPTVSYLHDVYQHSFQGATNSASGSMPLYCADFFTKYTGDDYVTQSPSLTLRVFVPKTFYDAYPPDDWDYYLRIYQAQSATSMPVYVVRTFRAGTAVESTGTNAFQDVALSDGSTFTNTDSYINQVTGSATGGLAIIKRTADMTVNVSGSVSGFSYVYVSGDLSAGFDTDNGTSATFSDSEGIFKLGGVGGGGGGGDNNWPTDDPTPTPDPPEVPGPSDDPIPQPDPPDLPDPKSYPVTDPYTPDPDPPVNPIITYDPNPTGEPTDYRPWLNAILVLLRKINTTISDGFGDLRGWLTNHCDHIREQIHSDSLDLGLHIQLAIENGVISFERWLQGTFAGYFLDEIDYLLGENFRELEGYLYELFHWLASQFDFTFGGTNYDDSSVIYWLRRIYARLGGGAPNPGDDGTVDESFDWWAWLLGLITDALGGIITDFVGDVGGFLATLADVFPFSIPGDIVAYLTLLDAARETPRFVVTIPGIQGWWQSFDYEIDLSPFDDAMGVVRGMYLIYWGLILVMKTDWLGGVFDFASRAVVQFFDKITGGAYSA